MMSSDDWQRVAERIYVCGKYSIYVAGRYGSYTYIAWPPKPGRPPKHGFYNWNDYTHRAIGYYASSEEARTACKRHYDKSLSTSGKGDQPS